MKSETKEPAPFVDLLEARLREITAQLRNSSIDELSAELSELLELLNSYKRNDELLECLLYAPTHALQREQIREVLKERIALTNRQELERLYARSHELIGRSARLLARIDRQIYARKHRGSGFAPEMCGYCKGTGGTFSRVCPVCTGRRTVLVRQPSLVCPRCKGEGTVNSNERSRIAASFCVLCHGTGWTFISP